MYQTLQYTNTYNTLAVDIRLEASLGKIVFAFLAPSVRLIPECLIFDLMWFISRRISADAEEIWVMGILNNPELN